MDPTTSFVLALIAIVVSGFSAIASFIAIGQTSRHHPKPYMTAHAGDGGWVIADQPTLTFGVTNYGNAPARDVLLSVRNLTTGWSGDLDDLAELPPSESIGARISLVSGELPRGAGFGKAFPSGSPKAQELEFTLTWRQWPGVKRVRRIRWHVDVDAAGKARLRHGRELGWVTQAAFETWNGAVDFLSEAWSTLRRMF